MSRVLSLFLCFCFIVCLAACGKNNGEFTSVDNTSSPGSNVASASSGDTSSVKYYPDSEKDFTGKVTIVGYWHCISSTDPDGTVTDRSKEEQYYLFESDGNMQNFYQGEETVTYEGYVFTETSSSGLTKVGDLVRKFPNSQITLKCVVEETRLTLSTDNANGQNYTTVYEREKFPTTK